MTQPQPQLEGVERGVIFTYYGPRRGWLFRRGIAAGVVVGVDQAIGVVHVRTLRQAGEVSVTDVGHIPLQLQAFARSVHSLNEKAPRVADEAAQTVAVWRQRHARGEVTAFSCRLWEAERRAWQSVPASEKVHGRDALYLAYAFPKKSEDGAFKDVEVGVHRHEQHPHA